MRPIITAAGDNANALRLDMNGEAVAVPFNLIDSVRTFQNLGLEERKAWLNAIRHGIEGEVRLCWIAALARPRSNRRIGPSLRRGLDFGGLLMHQCIRYFLKSPHWAAEMAALRSKAARTQPGKDLGSFTRRPSSAPQ